jgi:hypothetical protein
VVRAGDRVTADGASRGWRCLSPAVGAGVNLVASGIVTAGMAPRPQQADRDDARRPADHVAGTVLAVDSATRRRFAA